MALETDRQINVLVIESQKGPGEEFLRILEKEGFKVSLALNGKQGLKQAHILKPDIVFIDLRLPKKPGIVVLEEMIEILPNAIMVAMTDRATVTLALDALRQGAHEFLTKPCTPEELCAMVQRATKRHCLTLERKIKACRELEQEHIKTLAEQLQNKATSILNVLNQLEEDLTGHPGPLLLTRQAKGDAKGILDLVEETQ